MGDLIETQFELGGYAFGSEVDPLVIKPGGFDPGMVGWRTQDQLNSVRDGQTFGRDLRSPSKWSWEMYTNLETLPEALEVIEQAEAKWIGDPARSTPGAVMPLRYCIGGRTRCVYGRPRRFSHTLDPSAWQGVVEVVADFQRVDTLYYDDEPRSVSLTVIPGSTTGLTSPLIGPLTTVGEGDERIASVSDVGGTVAAPFVAVIQGPITFPWLVGPGWKLFINASLAYDQQLIIDTRPWAQTILRNDGVSYAGFLTRDSNLRDARLAPGGSQLKFGGTDATGTAHCTVQWRPTYHSL